MIEPALEAELDAAAEAQPSLGPLLRRATAAIRALGSPWRTAEEAALYARLALRTLEGYRRSGEGPLYCRQGARVVLYHRDDLDAWVARAGKTRNTLEERLNGVKLAG